MSKALFWLFWALMAAFVALALLFVVAPNLQINATGVAIIVAALLFFALGLALTLLTGISDTNGWRRRFLLLTGGSAAGIMVSLVLHFVLSNLFSDFWQSAGIGDEPFFFVMALIVLPIAFVVGAVGSVVMMARRR